MVRPRDDSGWNDVSGSGSSVQSICIFSMSTETIKSWIDKEGVSSSYKSSSLNVLFMNIGKNKELNPYHKPQRKYHHKF